MILGNHAIVLVRKERLCPSKKARDRPVEIDLWKKVRCQTGSKTLAKSKMARIVRKLGLGFLKPSKMN